MSMGNRIGALRARHAGLEERLREEASRPRPDEAELRRIKSEKLRLKEEIEKAAAAA